MSGRSDGFFWRHSLEAMEQFQTYPRILSRKNGVRNLLWARFQSRNEENFFSKDSQFFAVHLTTYDILCTCLQMLPPLSVRDYGLIFISHQERFSSWHDISVSPLLVCELVWYFHTVYYWPIWQTQHSTKRTHIKFNAAFESQHRGSECQIHSCHKYWASLWMYVQNYTWDMSVSSVDISFLLALNSNCTRASLCAMETAGDMDSYGTRNVEWLDAIN